MQRFGSCCRQLSAASRLVAQINSAPVSSAAASVVSAARSQQAAPLAVAENLRGCRWFTGSGAVGAKDSDKAETVEAEDVGEAGGAAEEGEADMSAVLAEKDAEIKDWKEKYQYAIAGTENMRTRKDNEIKTTKEFAIQKFSKDLLSVADVVELALKHPPSQMEESHEVKQLFLGLEGIQKNLLKVFESHGITVHNPVGEEFDPNTMEAMFTLPADENNEANRVVHVERVGYTLNGRSVRAAGVGVAA